MAIFTVHLNYYPACDSYVPYCYTTTALNNPKTDCYFLTSSPELAEKLTSICEQLPNTIIVCLDKSMVDSVIESVDSIFYHDGINSRWFDLFSIARHALVMRFIEERSMLCNLDNFITTDSDIAHFYDYSALMNEPGPREVYTRSPIISYFAIWHRETFAEYSNLGTMKRYFQHAQAQGGRCSDMHLLEWLIKNQELISWKWRSNDFGIALDTLRDFIYYSGLWIEHCNYSYDTLINAFPGGIWDSKDFLAQFNHLDFWSDILLRLIDQSGRSRLFLKRNKLLGSINRLNGLNKANFDKNSPYALYGSWVHNNTWHPYLDAESDLIPVPFIHFQGSTKGLAPVFSQFTCSRY